MGKKKNKRTINWEGIAKVLEVKKDMLLGNGRKAAFHQGNEGETLVEDSFDETLEKLIKHEIED